MLTKGCVTRVFDHAGMLIVTLFLENNFRRIKGVQSSFGRFALMLAEVFALKIMTL